MGFKCNQCNVVYLGLMGGFFSSLFCQKLLPPSCWWHTTRLCFDAHNLSKFKFWLLSLHLTPSLNINNAHLFMNTGSFRMDKSNLITLKQFQNGASLFPFDMTPDVCNWAHLHAAQTGKIELHIHWREALTHPVTIIVYLRYSQMLSKRRGEPQFQVEII